MSTPDSQRSWGLGVDLLGPFCFGGLLENQSGVKPVQLEAGLISMRNPWHDVKTPPQPPLFSLPAQAITLQACVDTDNGTVVFAVQAVDPINDNLIALWSSSAVPVERYLKTLHEAHREFLQMVWDACGPFA